MRRYTRELFGGSLVFIVTLALVVIGMPIGVGWYGAAHDALLPPAVLTVVALLMCCIPVPQAAAYGQFAVPAIVMVILTWVSYFVVSF